MAPRKTTGKVPDRCRRRDDCPLVNAIGRYKCQDRLLSVRAPAGAATAGRRATAVAPGSGVRGGHTIDIRLWGESRIVGQGLRNVAVCSVDIVVLLMTCYGATLAAARPSFCYGFASVANANVRLSARCRASSGHAAGLASFRMSSDHRFIADVDVSWSFAAILSWRRRHHEASRRIYCPMDTFG